MSDDNNGSNKKQKTLKESDVYDRQIRLWGADAQAKMKSSKILFVYLRGVACEILKNLVLAGVPVSLYDPRPATASNETSSLFFNNKLNEDNKNLTIAQMVKPQVEELNPLLGDCPIIERTATIADMPHDLSEYTIVIASRIGIQEALTLKNKKCNKLFIVDSFGRNGVCVMDNGEGLMYRPERGKEVLDPVPVSTYVPIKELLDVPLPDCINRFHKTPPPIWIQYKCLLQYYETHDKVWPSSETQEEFVKASEEYCKDVLKEDDKEQLLKLAGMYGPELAAVCAVLGGLVGNEIIKLLSGKGEPANNTILFDGNLCKAWTFLVQSKK